MEGKSKLKEMVFGDLGYTLPPKESWRDRFARPNHPFKSPWLKTSVMMDHKHSRPLGYILETQIYPKSGLSKAYMSHSGPFEIHNLEHGMQKQQSLIQKHYFREVKNGREALFWEYCWQKHPKLNT